MKRLFSIMITFSLLLGICVPATYAVTPEIQTEQYSTEELAQIEEERDALYNLIRVQLEEQDAEKYFEMFRFLADNFIDSKYFSNSLTLYATSTFYAPDGGWTYCENYAVKMGSVYFDKDDTLVLYENRNNSSIWEKILSRVAWISIGRILGFPFLGTIGNLSNKISSYLSWSMVFDSTGCLSYSTTYDKIDMKNIYVLMPWSNTPYITIPDSSYYDTVDYGT